MSAATEARSPTARANIAARMLLRNKTLGRAFDDCFEMGDGDEVVRRLIARADQDPAFARVLRDRGFGDWIEPGYMTRMGRPELEPRRGPTLDESFNACHPDFRENVHALALKHGKTWQQVYGWWRKYSEDCQTADQSPVWGEFQQWYKVKLGPPLDEPLGRSDLPDLVCNAMIWALHTGLVTGTELFVLGVNHGRDFRALLADLVERADAVRQTGSRWRELHANLCKANDQYIAALS